MNRRDVREILAAHADDVVRQDRRSVQRSPRHDQVQGLLAIAEQLNGILVPVEPDRNFRRRLHGELVLDAQRREAGEPTLFEQHRKEIIIGAAAIGIGSVAASVAGVAIAYVVRHRQGRANVAAG
jgi:hypothetical protein